MTDPTQHPQIVHRVQSDGLVLERVAHFKRVFERAMADNIKLDVHVLAMGQLASLKSPKIEAVDDSSVTLFGMSVIPVGPNQAVQDTGRFFIPLIDVVRVYEPSGISLASGVNPDPRRS